MASPPQADGYTLRRTYMSSMRLNAQHYLWKDAIGFNVHPDIPLRDDSSVRIADIGTGTAVWLTDMSRAFPSAQKDGFDISLDQCPHPAWMPSNSSLRKLDLYQPLPEDLVGKYDFVNLRLFLVVIKNDDPSPVLENLCKMLKPGGWLQWGDHNLDSWSVVSVEQNTEKSPSLEQMCDMLKGLGLGRWVPRLPEFFSQQGLVSVRKNLYPIKPYSRLYWTQLQFNSNEEYSYLGMDNSTPDADGPRYRGLISQAAKECQNGAAFNFTIEVTIGQKPL